jgi:hypothetical protein
LDHLPLPQACGMAWIEVDQLCLRVVMLIA